MTNIELIKKLKSSSYLTEDEESFQLEFLPGLSEEELKRVELLYSTQHLPAELREILLETKGWDSYYPESIYFDAINEENYTDLILDSINVGHDGLGNFWLLEIRSNGNLGKVYYACHDPAVLVIFCNSIHDYLWLLEEYYLNQGRSSLSAIVEKETGNIWKTDPNVSEIKDFREANPEFVSFLSEFTGDNYLVADLRKAGQKDGFAWGKQGFNALQKRHPEELIWVIRKKEKGFFSKLFGGK